MFVLFDLDGTLVDSFPAHRRAAEGAFRESGIAIDDEGMQRFLMAHDARSAGMQQDRYLDVWRRIQPLYRQEQASILAFPGIVDALGRLNAAGISAGLVTSKRRWAVENELDRLGWSTRFACVVCREDTRRHKPSPEPLLHAAGKLGEKVLAYVGDAPSDVQAAKAAGLPAVGVAWGWAGGAALRAASADWVVQSPAALAPLLQAMSGGEAARAQA